MARKPDKRHRSCRGSNGVGRHPHHLEPKSGALVHESV